jgi:hypothetical protein
VPRITEEQGYTGVRVRIERLGLGPLLQEVRNILQDFALLVEERVCLGVEVQFSARSDLVVVDLIHLRKAVTDGKIDVAVLVVPSDVLGVYLTDRGPKMADAKRHVREARADDLPLLLIALEHDGSGPALAKQPKRGRP